MWSDIETKRDYLNYLELAEVVSEVLLNPSMRPVSVGVFGTWGTGKSSLLNLIEERLREDAKDEVIIIRFDAWLYQGYDDARAALMDVIARRLYEAAKKDARLLGVAKSLLARVNTMRTLGLGIEVAAALHGVPLMGVGSKAVAGLGKLFAGTPEAEDTQAAADGVKAVAGLVDPVKGKSPPEHVDAFRQEFQKLLVGLDKTLVVFVDNLDRCLPEQTIHTLEALRLFLFMEQSAFVVAADEDMVRHSVSQHFDGANERHVTDYLDKLIQIPVRVPRLGVTEIRAYLFMLFAEAGEVSQAKLDDLRNALEKNLRASWKEPPITVDAASKLAGGDDAIRMSFDIAERMSALLAKSTFVEGNPRIVKRLLNVVRLRARIAARRGMPVDEAMVAKFALFERCADPVAVRKLYALINEAAQGKPEPIATLERLSDDPKKFEEACPVEWKKSADFLHDWLGLKPALSGLDLRPLVYLSKETAVLRSVAGDMSQSSAEAVLRLANVKTLSSPAAAMAIAGIASGEHGAVMRELIASLRGHADWSGRPDAINGAVLLADSDADAGRQLGAFLTGLPGKKSPWLKALVKDKAWAKGVA
ncbi:P-loop NTPase fold protein [Xanthomonas campestris pv. olitorii]|nr:MULTISPECIES: KAP family NTPase [Xanthomonas]WVK05125.1 KAP family NTPase [Xanthomonas campestris pv. olitorii]AKK65925.1 NTPase KAP [Xanthomonas oryzae pv. oryzicola]AKN99976.1 NTPase KAP [Xanthomonas oryzae pv. oryzicola]KOR46405.1 NTPase KAP [Xanthomonas oryzae]OLK87411.1 NTPase KAP [Xanthomonas oryzae pv. oryzicola]